MNSDLPSKCIKCNIKRKFPVKSSHKHQSCTPSFIFRSLLSYFPSLWLKQSLPDVASDVSGALGTLTGPLLSLISRSHSYHHKSRWQNKIFNVFNSNYFVGKQKSANQRDLQALIIIKWHFKNIFTYEWVTIEKKN